MYNICEQKIFVDIFEDIAGIASPHVLGKGGSKDFSCTHNSKTFAHPGNTVACKQHNSVTFTAPPKYYFSALYLLLL